MSYIPGGLYHSAKGASGLIVGGGTGPGLYLIYSPYTMQPGDVMSMSYPYTDWLESDSAGRRGPRWAPHFSVHLPDDLVLVQPRTVAGGLVALAVCALVLWVVLK